MAFISLDAKYQPLSFEEYIAPYVAHQQAYERYTQGLEDLANDASKYAQYIPKDSQAYATQQRYLEGLKNTSDVLYNEGMNINNNFNTVRALRKQYTDEILPINSAAQRLGALTDLASQYEAKGLRTFNMPSIDDLVKDGTLTFKTYSPEKIKQEGMLYGAALLANNPTKRYLQKIAGDPYHNVLISENKLDPQVYQELMSDPSNNRAIISALATQGITPNDEVFNEVAQQYILGVIEGSVRKEESQVLSDEGAKASLDLWKYRKQKEIDTIAEIEKQKRENQSALADLLSGSIKGVDYISIGNDPKDKKRSMQSRITNSATTESLSNHILGNMNKNNYRNGKIQKINEQGKPDGKFSNGEIESLNNIGVTVVKRGGLSTYIVVGTAKTKEGKQFRVEIDPDLINTNVTEQIKSENASVRAQGGYDRMNTYRNKLKKKIVNDGNIDYDLLSKISNATRSTPEKTLEWICYEPTMVLANMIAKQEDNIRKKTSLTTSKE